MPWRFAVGGKKSHSVFGIATKWDRAACGLQAKKGWLVSDRDLLRGDQCARCCQQLEAQKRREEKRNGTRN